MVVGDDEPDLSMMKPDPIATALCGRLELMALPN
jgi:hypothetical protein